MTVFRLLLAAIVVTALVYDVSYCSQQIVTNTEFKNKRLKQIDEFEKNGIRKMLVLALQALILDFSNFVSFPKLY